MFLADLYNNNKRLSENISPIDLAEILFNALMQKYPEAVKRYGHEVVGDAVMNYAEDAEDIRSMSDVDIAVEEIIDDLANYRGDKTNELEPDSDVPLQEDQQLSIQDLAVISDQALDAAYGYGRSSPGNTFGWQANLQSAAYAKKVIDAGVTDIETIADAIHKGWNQTAKAFVSNPDQFSDTEKLKAAGKLEAKLQQRAKLMQIDYAALPEDEKEKDRVVARVLLQAIKGQNPVTENLRKWFKEKWVRFGPDGKIRGACARGDDSEGKPKCLPQAKAHALGKKGRKYAAAKKRREDPNPERRGPAKNVATKKKSNEGVAEGTNVTDYNPKSQGGTRKELLAKYHNTKDPKDAEAARKAGATQKELRGVAEGSTSHAELAKLAHDAYVAATRQGNGTMAAYYLKQYLKHKADAAKDKKDVAEGSDDIEYTRQFRDAIALAKSQKAIRQARYGKDQKFYADGTPVTPEEVARRAAERKAKKKGVAEGLKPEEISKEAEELVAKNGYEGALKFALMMANLGRDPSWLPIIRYIKSMKQGVSEAQQLCPECGGPAFSDLILAEKQDACYHKVKSRYKVWPSAYASGALVQCRKKGAANWGKKKTNEAKESPTQDYQKMMNFVQAQRLSGVPPEQQVAVALFKELEKTKAFNKQLDAELKAAGERADIGAEQGELATKELGKHRGELEKEKQKQQASRQQLQALSQQLEQLKTAPNVDAEASQAIEQQIAELEQKMQDRQGTGVSADKITELEQAIAKVQQGETVDADAIKKLEQQFADAETAAKTAKEKVGQVKDYESAIAKLNAEIDALTAEVNKDEKQIADIQGALANRVEPSVQKVDKLEPIVAGLDKMRRIMQTQQDQELAAARQAYAAQQQAQPEPVQLELPVNQQQELPLDTPQYRQAAETRFYFSPKATLAETLRTDFAMTQDNEGWYLTAAQGPAKLLEAQRAFGIPKVKQVKLKEVRISDYTGRAGTLGDENATSPIGSLPRKGRRPA